MSERGSFLGVVACLLWVPVLATAGCSAGPITAWQKSLETYVVNEGNGDPNVLRSMDRSPSESDFGFFGKREGVYFVSTRRTDAHGELIGYEHFDQRDWYIFLVGIVQYNGGAFVSFPMDEPRVLDIRLVAFSGTAGVFSWLVGPSNTEAQRLYCQHQMELWRRSHESRSETATAPTLFPKPKDIFRLTIDPDTLTVLDEHSGSRWSLAIPASAEP